MKKKILNKKTKKNKRKTKKGGHPNIKIPDYYKLYCFWTGTNEMSENRKKCFDTLKNSGLEVVLITENNINNYIKEPLHEGYEYLSLTHRSDYLRIYFMNFYGGAYSDIKKTSESFIPSIELLEKNPNMYGNGFKEIDGGVPDIYDYTEDSNGEPVFTKNESLSNELQANWNKLIGNGAYIFKPNTKFTNEWYSNLIKEMDKRLNNLKKYPARSPTEQYSEEYHYPIQWAFVGQLFHPLNLKYKDNILNTLPMLSLNDYRGGKIKESEIYTRVINKDKLSPCNSL